jgi:phage terminase large subunit GpA-like protein
MVNGDVSNSPVLEANANMVANNLLAGLKPPPDMTISQWAEEYRILSGSASSEPGRWSNARTPYLVEIMDELSPQSSATDVVFMKGSQIGGTEVLINTALYYIKHCPSPIGQFQTTEQTAKRFLKQRENPAFTAMGIDKLFYGDEMYLKEFPGGALITGWSNSPSNLRSMPIRIALCDEISEWAKDCGGQGDPCELVKRRTTNFPRKKRFWNSTPGIDGECNITEKFRLGDQRHYQVPCPHCGVLHKWQWSNIVWDRDSEGNHLPRTVRMRCPHCGKEYGEHYKTDLMAQGQWVAENQNGAYPSFHINALYSPLGWYSWENAVTDFLEAQGDVNKMKSFTNNILGEAWNIDGGMQVDQFGLMERCEDYDAEVPEGVLVLTAGVDTQDDRLEVEIVGWGVGLESWGITNRVLVGDPSQPAVWELLDNILKAGYINSEGNRMYVASTLIDAGGHKTDYVYRFTAQREWRNVFASIGKAGIGRPIASRPRETKKSAMIGASVVPVGVDTAKDQLFDWLTKERVCAGYCHFPRNDEYNNEFFAQLTAEKRVKHYVRGNLVWGYKKTRERNEALDRRIYARAALDLIGVDVDAMAENGVKFLRNVSEPYVPENQGRRTISSGVSV